MATAIAQLRYLHMAPRKVRLVADLIRGLTLCDAEAQLLLGTNRRATSPLLKLLRSCAANAVSQKMQPARLYVSKITFDQGPMLKRSLPRAQGRATPLQKKMSHIYLALSEGERVVPQYTFLKKTKKDKSKKFSAKPKISATSDAGAKEQPREKAGFFKRIFNRKSV